jgi:copper chaperone CopZ
MFMAVQAAELFRTAQGRLHPDGKTGTIAPVSFSTGTGIPMRYVPGIFLMVLLAIGDEIIIPALSSASGAEQTTQRQVVISIRGMMCASCGQEIEKTLKKVGGVGAVRVDVPNDRATVFYDERKVTPRQLAEAIRKAGYEAILPAESHP